MYLEWPLAKRNFQYQFFERIKMNSEPNQNFSFHVTAAIRDSEHDRWIYDDVTVDELKLTMAVIFAINMDDVIQLMNINQELEKIGLDLFSITVLDTAAPDSGSISLFQLALRRESRNTARFLLGEGLKLKDSDCMSTMFGLMTSLEKAQRGPSWTAIVDDMTPTSVQEALALLNLAIGIEQALNGPNTLSKLCMKMSDGFFSNLEDPVPGGLDKGLH